MYKILIQLLAVEIDKRLFSQLFRLTLVKKWLIDELIWISDALDLNRRMSNNMS